MFYLVDDIKFPWTDEGLKEAERTAIYSAMERKRDVIIWTGGPNGSRRVLGIANQYGGLQVAY